MTNIQEQLRQTCEALLRDGTVKVVIGYGQDAPGKDAYPLFVTRPEDARKLVWNDRCFGNLAAYLTRKNVKALGKPAIVVKGCDEKALVVLAQESQIDRGALYVIGVACEGVGEPRAAKCATCTVHKPRLADVVLGDVADTPGTDAQYADIDAFMQRSAADRAQYWIDEFARCIKCYACREVCPMCYCNQCIVDKNRPAVIDTSATLKGNFAWQITRAFHQAGRCIACDECTRACPAGINLRLLNQSLAKAAGEQFHYRAGMDAETPPIIGAYSLEDKEGFIR